MLKSTADIAREILKNHLLNFFLINLFRLINDNIHKIRTKIAILVVLT